MKIPYSEALLYSFILLNNIHVGVTLNRNQNHQNFTQKAASEIEKLLTVLTMQVAQQATVASA